MFSSVNNTTHWPNTNPYYTGNIQRRGSDDSTGTITPPTPKSHHKGPSFSENPLNTTNPLKPDYLDPRNLTLIETFKLEGNKTVFYGINNEQTTDKNSSFDDDSDSSTSTTSHSPAQKEKKPISEKIFTWVKRNGEEIILNEIDYCSKPSSNLNITIKTNGNYHSINGLIVMASKDQYNTNTIHLNIYLPSHENNNPPAKKEPRCFNPCPIL